MIQQTNNLHAAKLLQHFVAKVYPWRALKRGCVLFITYTLPLRRTTRQSRWRCLSERSEFLTFIAFSFNLGTFLSHLWLPLVGGTGIEPVTPTMST